MKSLIEDLLAILGIFLFSFGFTVLARAFFDLPWAFGWQLLVWILGWPVTFGGIQLMEKFS